MISLLRVDDRLVHGQVAYGWTSSLNANVILVVNDEAKNDKFKAMALDLAKPSNVKLYIRGLEESGEIVQKFSESKNSNVLVIVKNIDDAYRLAEISGDSIKNINIGGIPRQENKEKITDFVYLDDNDFGKLHDLENKGIEIDFRMLPRDKKKSLKEIRK